MTGNGDVAESDPFGTDVAEATLLSVEAKASIDEHPRRARRSAGLLAAGASLGLLGMIATPVLFVLKDGSFWMPTDPGKKLNMYGQPFPSGQPFVDEFVSHSVNVDTAPAGKIFKCTLVPAAILLLLSRYSYYLSNVETRNDEVWLAVRTYGPASGVLMLVFAVIPDFQLMDIGGALVMYGFHCIGASGAVAIILMGEIRDLGSNHIGAMERTVRKTIVMLAIICLALFLVSSVMVLLMPDSISCCHDTYAAINQTVIDEAAKRHAYIQEAQDKELFQLARENPYAIGNYVYKGLYDTASGTVLYAKILCWWSEYVLLLLVLSGHMVLWYFCPERHTIISA